MKNVVLLFFSLFFLFPYASDAQRDRRRDKLREERLESWPPERFYSRTTLGSALQLVFRKHYDFCGFPAAAGNRDYTPPDIGKFLGRRSLRTHVETADINGGNLLHYIFVNEEWSTPLDELHYRQDRLLTDLRSFSDFTVQPEPGFDAFVLTKNCSGYLKACLDAGIEPPYAAFKTALSTDERRESSVLAVSGSFVSPLVEILAARDARTNELMAKLWLFYQANPQLIGKAYFLREFQGVMVKHLGSAEAVASAEAELGINVNTPFFGAKINSSISRGSSRRGSFSGTDWETIVYADFNGTYTRANWFAALPTPDQIAAYFQQLQPTFSRAKDFPLLIQGSEHRHYVTISGLPAELARMPWTITDLRPGTYHLPPRLETRFFEEPNGRFGCEFTVSGQPAEALFGQMGAGQTEVVPLRYRIRVADAIRSQSISFQVREELATSAHPIARITDGRYDLAKREDRRFAFQWRAIVEIEDRENPVDYLQEIFVSNVHLRHNEREVETEVIRVDADARRHRCEIVLETRQSWPLQRIDDLRPVNYNLSLDVHLPTRNGKIRNVRPLKTIVTFPGIVPEPAPASAPHESPGTDGLKSGFPPPAAEGGG
ncbi:MAG: hypothetical protein WBA17_13760 [Saprospiraceae bacterium]